MTKLVLEIPRKSMLDALLPVLKQMGIRFTKVEAAVKKEEDIAEAIRIVQKGCEMSSFGDALQYQIDSRKDRVLPFRP